MRNWMMLVVLTIGCDASGPADGGTRIPDAPFVGPDVPTADASYTPMPGSCGFESPAFCETFEDGPAAVDRSGELDASRWSVMRGMPNTPPSFEDAFTIGPAWIDRCRADLSNVRVVPDQDALICDPTETIGSRHFVGAIAAQNYGLSTYRIRQPFDFAGRTGTIKLDVELAGAGLGGWPAISIAADPSPAPSFDWEERGSGPRNGVTIEFNRGDCAIEGAVKPTVFVFREYAQTLIPASDDCVGEHALSAIGSLNHVEIYLTQSRLEVWASDASPDGLTFPGLHQLAAVDLAAMGVALPFDRGYVSLIGRNHATLKYWYGGAWLTRWDNVGFDGPVVDGWREHSVQDSLTERRGLEGCMVGGECQWRDQTIRENESGDVCPPEAACTHDGEARNVGYVIPNEDEAPISVTIPDVDPSGMSRARLVLAATYPWFEWGGMFPPPTAMDLRWRLNGGVWHDRFVTDVEANAFEAFSEDVPQPGAGFLNQAIDVDMSELRSGDNTLELHSAGGWTGSYRIAVTAIDLVLDSN
ncbi:MAG: hypothetical protein AB7S26_25430 [Sandaracinaceae bacterium]